LCRYEQIRQERDALKQQLGDFQGTLVKYNRTTVTVLGDDGRQ